MPPIEQVWTRRPAIGWAVVIAVACAVYATGISHEAIWYDEAISAAIAGHGIREILSFMPAENHPPLHFLILHVVQRLFGNAEWALRLPPVLAAVGMVALGAGPVRRLLGDRTAFIYAAVVLCMPAMLSYAHEARMYELATFAVTATALYGCLAATTGRTRDWASFGIASLLAAYLQYYGLVAAALAQVYVVGWVLLRRRDQTRRCLVTAALTLLGYLPWLVLFLRQALRVGRSDFWVPPISGLGILAAFLRPFAYREMVGAIFPVPHWWMTAALLLSLLLVVAGLALQLKRRAKAQLVFSLLLLGLYLGTMAVTITVSLVSTPIFHNRYMLVCAGLVALLVSMGLGQLRTVWLGSALAALVALNAFTIKDVYTQYFNLPFRQLQRGVGQEIQPGDLIVTSGLAVGPSFYYFPAAVTFYASNSFDGARDELVKAMRPRVRYNEGLTELLATHRSFWHITDHVGIGRDVEEMVGASGWELAADPRSFPANPPYSFVGFTVARYEHTGRQGSRPGYGTVKLHLTGLRPVGRMLIALHDRFPPEPYRPPFRFRLLGVSSDKLDATISALPHGDYVLTVLHDENGNFWPDANEALWIANQDKLDPKLGPAGFTFDALKLPFREAERSFEITMPYPAASAQ